MIGVTFKTTLEKRFNRKVNDSKDEYPEILNLIEGLMLLCQRTCAFQVPGQDFPVLDLTHVEFFLRTYEHILNKMMEDEELLEDTRVEVLCFHLASRKVGESPIINFYLYETSNRYPPPFNRVVCSVVNNNVYH